MKALNSLIKRDIKMFFKDKGMFFASMITPFILLLLFVTFLGNVYRDSINSVIPAGMTVPDELIEGFVGGWLFSSLLAVCCVTVAFCSNMLMVQDKVTGAERDLTAAPVKSSIFAAGYYVAAAVCTLIICAAAMCACMVYLSRVGWYLTTGDVLLTCLDIFLLVMFGTALSSVINQFLSTQGQITAVGTIVSSCYGFICGAYMPISQFSEGIQKFVSLLPGTYGTALVRNHLLGGALNEFEAYFPAGIMDDMKKSFDVNISFFGHDVTIEEMYIVLICSVIVLLAAYILLSALRERRKKRKIAALRAA